MKIYILEFSNGLEYDEHECITLGIYKTKKDRAAGRKLYEQMHKDKTWWPFNTNRGKFLETEQLVGNIFPVRLKP